MKISIIITTHNNPEYLKRVLDGFLHQCVMPDEIVVADDGSKPETRNVVQAFSSTSPFPVLHSWQPHAGYPRLTHTRNLATRHSSGDYLVYIDGDCVPGPSFVKDQQQLAKPGWYVQGKRNFVTSKGLLGFTGSESAIKQMQLWFRGCLEKLHLTLRIPGLATSQKGIHGTRGCNIAAFRKDIININGWDQNYIGFWREDSDFVLRLIRSGVRRKNALFSAVVFHLEHATKDHDEDMKRNTALLEKAKTGPIQVANGLFTPEEMKLLEQGIEEHQLPNFSSYQKTA